MVARIITPIEYFFRGLPSLPTFASATLELEFNIGGPFTQSGVYSDASATVAANVGDTVQAIKDNLNRATLSSASRGPTLITSPLLGNKRCLYCHDLTVAQFLGTYTKDVGAGGDYAIAAVIFTPRAWGLGGATHHAVAAPSSTGPRTVIRSTSTTDKWASWQSSWVGATGPAFGPLEPHVLVWEYTGGTTVKFWLDGVANGSGAQTYSTLLNSWRLFSNGGNEKGRYGLAWLGFWAGAISDAEIQSASAVLASWFPASPQAGYTHQVSSRLTIPEAGQGYTTDGTYHYVTDDTTVYKYDAGGSLVDSQAVIVIVGQDHTGDLCHSGGVLYTVSERINSGTDADLKSIARWNASDLSPIDFVEITEPNEVSGIVHVPSRNRLYVVSFYTTGGTTMWEYHGTTLAFIGSVPHTVSTTIQGITYRAPYYYFARDAGLIYRMHEDHTNEAEYFISVAGDYLGGGVKHSNGIEYLDANVAVDDLRTVISETENVLRIAPNTHAPSIY